MLIEDALFILAEHGFDILIKHDTDELGHIHLIKENTTRVLYSFDELIEFCGKLEEENSVEI